MRNLLIVILLLALVEGMAGCSTITYESATGEKATYTRVGPQNLSGITIAKQDQDIAIKIESQRTMNQELSAAVADIAKTAAALSTK